MSSVVIPDRVPEKYFHGRTLFREGRYDGYADS